MTDRALLTLKTSEGKWVVATTVMGSGVAMLNGTDVSVALPALGADLGAGVAALQWVLNGYMLTLAALILVGGSLGDRYGRRRLYLLGVAWFAVASILCAVSPNVEFLIGARVLQGVGAALLTPGSLAIIQSCFVPDDRSTAIGAWSGLTGIAAAVGPLVGGLLIDGLGWRWIFLVPLPLAAVVIWVGLRHVPESFEPTSEPLDVTGALLAVVALGAISYSIIAYPETGWSPASVGVGATGLVALAGFFFFERSKAAPMLPLSIFASRQFTAANLLTFVVYAALGGVFFLVVVHLQTVVGYNATAAGASTIPIMALLLAGSPAAGRLAQRIGPRVPLTIGPLLLAGGTVMMGNIRADAGYVTDILPSMLVYGVGLTLTVTPVTATVLAAVEDRYAGLASGVNNAVARTGQLLAVAALPVLGGLTGGDFADPEAFAAGFGMAMMVAAGLSVAGGIVAWTMIGSRVLSEADDTEVLENYHCGVEAPPVVSRRRED
ncbi:MAG TPA: MFS transporter [Acidimicrobiia bacterium]|nr:MFS transporter [Acidimicrobiia bacterium]